MRVLVTGSRHFSNAKAIRHALEGLPEGSVIIQGGATGADKIARTEARLLGFQVITVPADWTKHGKAAGPIRNQKMLDEQKPDLVIAFPLDDSRGTWHMVRIAQEAGVEVVVVKAEGEKA